MDKDTRHALGNGSEDDIAENELPMPHPFEYGPKRPPRCESAGNPNPAINERRPIARMHPDVGSGNLKRGVAFVTPMGEPYDD